MRDFKGLFGVLALSVGLMVADHTAFAQAGGVQTSSQSASTNSSQLEEIIVTAQKRGQNLQDVPISISAFSAATLASAGVTNLVDVQQIDSSLTISVGGGGTAVPFMRGVGNPSGFISGNEASVPLYIDDVYYSRFTLAYLDLADVDRVEVLKGPQGTLFGRNASGGLFSVFTRDPDPNHAVGEATVGYGNYDTKTTKLYASTPLVGDKVAADISVSTKDQGEGWGLNDYTGDQVWKERYISLRSKLVANVTDATRVTLIGWFVNEFTEQGAQYARAWGTIGGTPTLYGPQKPVNPEDDGGFYNIDVNYNPSIRIRSAGGSVKVQQDIDFADLVSISSYRNSREMWQSAGDLSPYPFLSYYLYQQERDITQELQVKSKRGSSFDWIVGAYYLNTLAGYDPTRVFGDAFGRGSSGPNLADPTLGAYLDIIGLQTTNSYSTFGQATFHVVPNRTNLTLGLRYTIDDIHGVGRQDFTAGGVTFPFLAASGGQDPFDQTVQFKKLTYKGVLDHHFTESIMGFASVSRGYKAGTFNTLPLDGPPTQPEVVNAYELGLKTELLENHARLNLSLFRNNITDPQVTVIHFFNGIGATALQNAKSARTQGIELSGQAIPASGVTLRFSADYLDAKFTSFQDAPFLYQNPNPPPYGFLQTSGDASGHYLAQSPRFKGNVGANYLLNTAIGDFDLDAGVSYTSGYFWAPDNFYKTGAYALVDGSITYRPSFDDHLGFRVWGKNLTSHEYYETVQANSGDNADQAAPAPPRTFGIEVSYKFL